MSEVKIVQCWLDDEFRHELVNAPIQEGFKLLSAAVVPNADGELVWIGTYVKAASASPANKPMKAGRKPKFSEDDLRARITEALETSSSMEEVARKVGLHSTNVRKHMADLGIVAEPAFRVIVKAEEE